MSLVTTVCKTCGGSGEVAVYAEDDSYEAPELERCDNCAGCGWEPPIESEDLPDED